MNKLTPENIKFIDNYLVKADVIYLDIRVEMIDHIATALESRMQTKNEDFYNAFKDYMVEHKAELIERDKKYIKAIRLQLLKTFFKNLISLQALGLAFLSVIIISYIFSKFHIYQYKYFFLSYFVTIYGLCSLFYIIKYKPLKGKFSAIGIMFSIHLFIWIPWQMIGSGFSKISFNYKLILAYTFLTIVIFAYWKTVGKYLKKYNNNYNTV